MRLPVQITKDFNKISMPIKRKKKQTVVIHGVRNQWDDTLFEGLSGNIQGNDDSLKIQILHKPVNRGRGRKGEKGSLWEWSKISISKCR